MNANRILNQIQVVRAELAALEQMLSVVTGDRDNFALLLYQSRRDYCAVPAKKSSAKRLEEIERRSYIEASRFGFRGPIRDWVHLLRLSSTVREDAV